MSDGRWDPGPLGKWEPGPRPSDFYRVTSNYRFRVHAVKDLRLRFSYWDHLDRQHKLLRLGAVRPIFEERGRNTTTEDLIRHIHDKLDGQAVDDIDKYAIGSGTTPPSITDTDLDVREDTQLMTATTDAGLTLETSSFWDTTEANGITFAEGGMLAGGVVATPGSGGVLCARVVFGTAQVKDATKTFTVDHDITGTPG